MLDDPSESAFVRGLIQAGAEDRVTDIDYNKGLVKHVTIIAAGTLLPAWAKGLASSGAASSVSGISAKVIAFIVGLPVVAAGVVASVMLSNQEPEMRPADSTESTPALEMHDRSLTAPQPIAPLKGAGTAVSDREASGDQHRLHPTSAARKQRKPHYSKRTTNRIVPSIPAKDRTAAKTFGSSALSSSETVDPQFHRALTETVRPTTKPAEDEQEKKELISSRPVIKRRTISEIRQERQEQAETPQVDKNPFERETRMLAAANRLLESDPERSLELAKKGEREFPGSMFTEERRHVLILALIRLSRLDEARQLAAPYLHDYPKSPFAQRIRHALAKAQREQ